MSPGVTAPYTGNSGELFPYENGPASLVQEPLAGSDEALVRGVSEPGFDTAPYLAYAEGMAAVGNAAIGTAPIAGSDEALVRGVGEATFDRAPYIAYAEGMSEAAGNDSDRIPQQNVSMR
jgi:hypothetical protein